MTAEKNKNRGFNNIISSITSSQPLNLNNEKVEESEIEIEETNESAENYNTNAIKTKGKKTPKEKALEFLEVILDETSVIKNKGQIHVSEEMVNKVKMLSSVSGIPMLKITDAILLDFFNKNKDNIKKLINTQL